MYQDLISFIRKTYNKPEGFIPLHEPVFRGNEKKYLIECIDSSFVSSVGKFVNRFEEMVAEYTGAKYVIAAVNGTAALHIALLLSNVKQDDEVITQPLTFIATVNAVSYAGAKPVFIDVDRDTMGLSPSALRKWLDEHVEMRKVEVVEEVEKVEGVENSTFKQFQPFNKTTGKRITACIPMHTFGHPCRIDEIKAICAEFNIILIEDAAESLGSTFKGKHTGTFGKFGVLSFNGNKTITTGGGGMILTDDKDLAKIAKHLTTTAKVSHKWDYVHDMIGYNYRLTNLAAALGVAQMEQLPEIIESKRKLAEEYKTFFEEGIKFKKLEKIDAVKKSTTSTNKHFQQLHFITEPKHSSSNYWLNAVLLSDRIERDTFLEYTNRNGIMTRPLWELMNRLPMFINNQTGDLSNAEWLADRVVNIPSSVT